MGRSIANCQVLDVTEHRQPHALVSGPKAYTKICAWQMHFLGKCVAHDSRKPRIKRLRGNDIVVSVNMAFCALAALGVCRAANRISICGKRMGPPSIHHRAIEGDPPSIQLIFATTDFFTLSPQPPSP